MAFLFFTDITNTISINNSNTTTTNLATKAKSVFLPVQKGPYHRITRHMIFFEQSL